MRRRPLPRFLFVVHALSEAHRQIIGVRGAKLGLSLGKRDGSDPKDVSHICSFSLPRTALHPSIEGDVVAIPLPPAELLADQEQAVHLMHRAVKLAEKTGRVDVVGLGSLCAVVGRRGVALQERLNIPVTTGGAATVWTLFSNAIQANPHRETMGVLGASSPVGKAVIQLLHQHRVPLQVDSRKVLRGLNGEAEALDAREIAEGCKWLIGCGPTGPLFDDAVLRAGSTVLDVALPHSFTPTKRQDVRVFFAERMTMPSSWKRGVWGRVYHMVSGYGYNTVLACLVEPVVMAAFGEKMPFAQGRSIELDAVHRFGKLAGDLGFHSALSSEFWKGGSF